VTLVLGESDDEFVVTTAVAAVSAVVAIATHQQYSYTAATRAHSRRRKHNAHGFLHSVAVLPLSFRRSR